jgi:hypothetical protein
MYGDDYKPDDKEHYNAVCQLFDSCESREELSSALMLTLLDASNSRQDLHVAHKRACLKKGWER